MFEAGPAFRVLVLLGSFLYVTLRTTFLSTLAIKKTDNTIDAETVHKVKASITIDHIIVPGY